MASTTTSTHGRSVLFIQFAQLAVAIAIVAIAVYRMFGAKIRTNRIENMILGAVSRALCHVGQG
jgi:hypothetical protein